MTEPTEQNRKRAPSAALLIGIGPAVLGSLLLVATRRPPAEPERVPVAAANATGA